MTFWIIAGIIAAALVTAEACYIIPDKLPFIRKKVKKHENHQR